MVSTQAHTTFRATPQRTADSRRMLPTPMIAPVMVWVVLTGMPKLAEPRSAMAPAVSAQKPPIGWRAVRRIPIVRTIRQPPKSVPSPIAAWQVRTTQMGT